MVEQTKFELIRGTNIPEVSLIDSRKELCMKIARIVLYFFKRGVPTKGSPFRGFILEGPPSTGKTEMAKQVARIVDDQCPHQTYLLFVDSGDIAAPKWGEAEKNLRNVFSGQSGDSMGKQVILMDDIDCLMIKRGAEVAKEWHFSINSILLHELDKIDPSKRILIATTNRSDLIDDALRSRLYKIEVPPPPLNELISITKELIHYSGLRNKDAEEALGILREKLETLENPTIRDVQHLVVTECIERGFWS